MNGAGCSMPRRSRAARRLPGISSDAPARRPRPRLRHRPHAAGGCAGWCLETARSSARARILLTANASHLVAMQDDPALREAAQAADLVTPDGMSLVWAGPAAGRRGAGTRRRHRPAGGACWRAAPRHGLRVFLLGATPAVMQRLLAHCRTAYPGLEIAGWRRGYFTPDRARGGGAAGGRTGGRHALPRHAVALQGHLVRAAPGRARREAHHGRRAAPSTCWRGRCRGRHAGCGKRAGMGLAAVGWSRGACGAAIWWGTAGSSGW